MDVDLWVDKNHLDPEHGHRVFDEEKKAVKELQKLIKDTDVSDSVKKVCQSVIDKLIEADKILAHTAYVEAVDRGGDPKELEKCEKEFGKAQKKLDDKKYEDAIKHYKNAWEHAQKA